MKHALWKGLLLTAVSAALSLGFGCANAAAGQNNAEPKEILLAENGVAKASIVIPEKTSGVVLMAARELAEHLKKMTGAEFRIGTEPDAKLPTVIRLGGGDTTGFKPDTCVICAEGNTIHIYGKDDPREKVGLFDLFLDNQWKGTLTGVYRFLDRLGVRWYAPGEEHAFIPKKPTLRFPEGVVRDAPFFADRKIESVWNFKTVFPDAGEYGCEKDSSAAFLWCLRNGASTRSMVEGSHSEAHLRLWENKEWLSHPERHQLMKNGKRNPRYSCWTDPGVIEFWKKAADAYFSGKSPKDIGLDLKPYLHSKWPYPFISPDEFMVNGMDNSDSNDGRCLCERCQAFRKKYPCPDDSEILWRAESEIARYIAEKHPGKYISTLTYGTKKYFPKYTEIPNNIRLRLCISGPKEITCPNRFADEIGKAKSWSRIFGRENMPLWTYQCICFGRMAPGVPDTYPGLTFRYIQEVVRPYTAGMYLENISLTHTMRNLDSYLFFRGMWNPDMDYERERAEFFRNYYGAAGEILDPLFDGLEKKWCRFWMLATGDKTGKTGEVISEMMVSNDRSSGATDTRSALQRLAWSKVYTSEYMARLDGELAKAEKAAAGDPVRSMRVGLLRKWFFDVMQSERNEVMGKEDMRKNIKLPVNAADVRDGDYPSEEQWETAKANLLIPAVRMVKTLKAPGQFKVLASPQYFYFQGEFTDDEIEKSATDPNHAIGCEDVWKDNCAELFFYAPADKKFWQIILTDSGAWHSQTTSGKNFAPKWTLMPGFRVRTFKRSGGWGFVCAVPRKEVECGDGELRFNFTRERNVRGKPVELSTWSPLCMTGNWHFPDNYGTLLPETQEGK